MSAHPEHALQVMINKWVRAHVPQPHFFCGIDRAKATGRFTHAREKARGIIAGTPDTILIVPGTPLIAVELKAPGNTPTDVQRQIGAAIQASGHHWAWCDSVQGYADILFGMGVPLIGAWGVMAQGHDATLASAAILREEAKTGKPSRKRSSKPRAEKPSASQIRKMEAVRGRVAF